jgi:uncharacterized protein (TIGR03435 family)
MNRFPSGGGRNANGLIWLCLITTSQVLAQPQVTTAPLAFEVASVKPSTSGNNGVMGGCHGIDSKYGRTQLDAAPPLGRCVIRDARLSHMIGIAYGVPMGRIQGAADWVIRGTDRFNVEAKADDPTKATEAQLLQMLQALLADRFKLKFRREDKDVPGFALVVAKNGPKLQEAKGDEVVTLLSKTMPDEPGSLTARKMSMPALANALTVATAGPVIDKTDLIGDYDLKLSWDATSGPSIFSAVTEQLGLRLEPQKVPVSFFVIESAQRPSAN